IDLGLGMQLTNICRDVLEDAQNGRVYLPEDRVAPLGLDLGVLGTKGKTPKQLKELVEDLLNTAEQYYDSGLRGLAFIPLRPRVVILLASQLYRHIGIKLSRKDFEVLQGRVSLNVFEKLLVALKTLPMLIDPRFWTPQKHERSLHLAIQEAPGTNA
ncbi:MAG: squalene/phytoene synthase family protein, partial [Bacteriovoracaceae bacterium]|nr:squalene/phytoene synthase family protein [Bacteriovoracaceae bacterium]